VKLRRLLLPAGRRLTLPPRRAPRPPGAQRRWPLVRGPAVSTTYGSYSCQIKFSGDRALIKLTEVGIQIVGMLDEEASWTRTTSS